MPPSRTSARRPDHPRRKSGRPKPTKPGQQSTLPSGLKLRPGGSLTGTGKANVYTDLPLVPDELEKSVDAGLDATAAIAQFVTEWLLDPGRAVKLILGAILLMMGTSRVVKAMTGTGVGGNLSKLGAAVAIRSV